MTFLRTASYYDNRFHDKQFEAWRAYKSGLNLFLAWSRRSGKSNLFTEIMVEDIEQRGHDCLYVAKTQKQARRIIWKKLFAVLHGQSGWRLNESRLEAVYKGGPLVSVKGADLSADNLAGSAYRIIACDEFALWRKPSIVKEILAPMLADHEGQMLYGSTKRGKNHFYDLHQLALSDPKKYYVSEATLYDNTFLTEKGREIVLSEYAGSQDPLYKQEILNEYVSFEGMAFALPENDYIVKRWDPAELDFAYHWCGMDHGYSPDPTAVVWIAYSKRLKYFLAYSEYKEKELLIYDHTQNIRAHEPYRPIDTFSDIDPQVISEYAAVGLSLTMANKTNKDAKILRLVNHLRTGQLKIASCCKELLKEMQSYEWGQDGNDHLCFAAGTMITTRRGLVPIEDVNMSDEVLTRFGWDPVRAHGVTGIEETISLEFTNGSKLVCTPNHPIYTKNRGFVRADALTYNDNICSSSEWLKKKKLNLKVLYLGDILNQKRALFADILYARLVTLKKGLDTCIEKSGRMLTALSLMAGMFTTKMGTPSIMTFPIWSVFLPASIGKSTRKIDPSEEAVKNSWLYLKKSDLSQKSGILQRKDQFGTLNMLEMSLPIGHWWTRPVQYAGRVLKLSIPVNINLNFVLQNVCLKSAETPASTMSQDAVLFVKKLMKSISILKHRLALDRVGLLGDGKYMGEKKVYNLSIEHNHEYFANGVLVSNCDALNYGYNNLTLPPQNDKKKDTLPKHVYKPNDTNQNQSFGDESVSNNIKYEDHDYYD